jgi:hypothetical protein
MIGYVTKDQGQAHYNILTNNITSQELTNGRREHEAMCVSFNTDKKILTWKSVMNEALKFYQRCLYPCVPPFHYIIMYMIQSESYTFTPDILYSNKKFDYSESSTFWRICFHPLSVTVDDVMKLFFDYRSYGKKVIYLILYHHSNILLSS